VAHPRSGIWASIPRKRLRRRRRGRRRPRRVHSGNQLLEIIFPNLEGQLPIQGCGVADRDDECGECDHRETHDESLIN